MNKSSNKKSFIKVTKLIEKCLAQDKINEAIKHLLVAQTLEPKNFAVLNELGTCHSKIGDYKSALDYHLKAHYLSKDNPIFIANILALGVFKSMGVKLGLNNDLPGKCNPRFCVNTSCVNTFKLIILHKIIRTKKFCSSE